MECYLQHHGIKGQKWGIRRYQNADGSLTDAGKQRQSEQKKRNDVKKRGTMTDDQLKAKIKRIQLERQLRTLTEQEINPGRVIARDILKKIGQNTITVMGTGALLYAGKAAVSKEFDPKEFAEALFNGGPKREK